MIEDADIDRSDLDRRTGDDTPPLFHKVRDEPYRRGTITSVGRTASEMYQRFVNKHKEVRDGK
jgi:hypothetical protein